MCCVGFPNPCRSPPQGHQGGLQLLGRSHRAPGDQGPGEPIFILHLGSPHHALYLISLGTTKTVAFSLCQECPTPVCLANPRSSFQTQPRFGASLKSCSQVEATALLGPAGCCTCSSHRFTGLICFCICRLCRLLADYPPWHREGILNVFPKWINTGLPQSHQSQCCPLGSQNKPALVSQGKPSGMESHLVLKQIGTVLHTNVAAESRPMGIKLCNPSITKWSFSSQSGQSPQFRRK